MQYLYKTTAEENDGEGDETADGDDSEGSCYHTSYKCLTAAGRPPSSATWSSDSDDLVADEMGSESDSEPLWSNSRDLSHAIAYSVLTALDRYPESLHFQYISVWYGWNEYCSYTALTFVLFLCCHNQFFSLGLKFFPKGPFVVLIGINYFLLILP